MLAPSDHPPLLARAGLNPYLRRLVESSAVLVPQKPLLFQLCFALAVVSISTILRYAFGAAFGITSVFLLYHPAVLIAAWYGRLTSGLIATALSIIVATFLWTEPPPLHLKLEDWVTLSLFLVIGVFQCLLIEIFQRAVLAHKQSNEQLAEARERLREHAEELELKVQQRTKELSQSVSELQELSYTLVHDLRAPLRAMRSFAEILEMEYAARVDEQGKDYLSRISHAALRMDELICDVLAFSGVAGQPASITPIDLEAIVKSLIRDYPQIKMQHATFTIASPLHPVMGSKSLLLQCLSNLLANAVKFVPPGSKALIRIFTESSGTKVRVNVQDNGIGISEELHQKIFEPFQRAHGNLGYSGHGIGLAIVMKAVQRMNGRVGISSKPGQGSTFWLELPALPITGKSL